MMILLGAGVGEDGCSTTSWQNTLGDDDDIDDDDDDDDDNSRVAGVGEDGCSKQPPDQILTEEGQNAPLKNVYFFFQLWVSVRL